MFRLDISLLVVFSTYLSLGSANIGIPMMVFQSPGQHVTLPKAILGHTVSSHDMSSSFGNIEKLPQIAVVFVQDQLSSEDFLRLDTNGQSGGLFPNLKDFSGKKGFYYYPSVKSPMHSVDALSNRYEEQVELKNAHEAMKYLSDTELSDNTVLVIYLAPTDDDETRDKSLSRNDHIIGKAIGRLAASGMSYIAVFTASKHRSHDSHSVIKRHLMALELDDEQSTGPIYLNETDCLLYAGSIMDEDGNLTMKEVSCKTTNGSAVDIMFRDLVMLSFLEAGGYWMVTDQTLRDKYYMTVPVGFSFHCAEQITFNNVTINRLQLQLFHNSTSGKFSSAYDCVGFFTLPIWMGLILALILITFTIFGIGMLSNISTFDHFDDPKGKPLTINTSE